MSRLQNKIMRKCSHNSKSVSFEATVDSEFWGSLEKCGFIGSPAVCGIRCFPFLCGTIHTPHCLVWVLTAHCSTLVELGTPFVLKGSVILPGPAVFLQLVLGHSLHNTWLQCLSPQCRLHRPTLCWFNLAESSRTILLQNSLSVVYASKALCIVPYQMGEPNTSMSYTVFCKNKNNSKSIGYCEVMIHRLSMEVTCPALCLQSPLSACPALTQVNWTGPYVSPPQNGVRLSEVLSRSTLREQRLAAVLRLLYYSITVWH